MVIGRVNSRQKADSAVQHFKFHLKTRILPLINNGVKKVLHHDKQLFFKNQLYARVERSPRQTGHLVNLIKLRNGANVLQTVFEELLKKTPQKTTTPHILV